MVLADDGISLTLDRGAPAGSAALSWVGGVPNFDVYRGGNPATVTSAGNVLAILGGRSTLDTVVPAANSGFYYLVISVGPCAPRSPAAICGANERCYPTTDGLSDCEGPVGAGTQGAFCTTDADCYALGPCINNRCSPWCRIGFSDCGGNLSCFSLIPEVFVTGQEYGVCF